MGSLEICSWNEIPLSLPVTQAVSVTCLLVNLHLLREHFKEQEQNADPVKDL